MRWLKIVFGIAIFALILSNTSYAAYYKVKSGDSLIKISKKLGFKAAVIKRLNPNVNWLKIRPGKKIVIPSKNIKRMYSTNKNIYIVKKGDSLIRIAKRFNIKPASIKKINAKVNWLKIRPGDKIKLPVYDNNGKVDLTKMNSSLYIIRKNDSLSRISKKLDISMDEIKKLNPDIDWSKIKPSNRIKLPENTEKQEIEKHQKKVVVRDNTTVKIKNTGNKKSSKFRRIALKNKKSFKPGEVGDGYYIVKQGDTLSSIARRFGLTLKQLMALNPNKSRFIKPKDLIVIPGELTKKIMLSEKENLYIPPKYLVYSTPYRIKRGDTLYKIARKFKTKVYVIKMLNNLGSNNLRAGNFIFVPNENMANKNKLEFEYSLLRERRRALVHYAERFIGNPYRFGGDSLLHGIDCSAFVQKIYRKFVRIRIPRTAEEQYRSVGVFIPFNRIQAGDLLFFHTLSYARVTHVGIYIGGNRFIHAAGRKSGIKISKLTHYYLKRLVGVKRIFSVSNKYVYYRHRSG